MKVKFKKYSYAAHAPTKATSASACYDVYSTIDVKFALGVTKK